MTYQAPLRAAVLWLADQPWLWDQHSIATLTGVSEPRAKAYCTALCRHHVLVRHVEHYARGIAFSMWRQQQPATRPGGHALEYRREADLRCGHYLVDHRRQVELGHRLYARRIALGWSLRQVAARAGCCYTSVRRAEAGDHSFPTAHIVQRIVIALGMTEEHA